MQEEIIGGSDHLVAFRIPHEGSYLLSDDLLDLFVAIVGSGTEVYGKFSLKEKEGYKRIAVNAGEPEIYELYLDSAMTRTIANKGDSVKAQLNIITSFESSLIGDGRKNLVTYVEIPTIVKPLSEVEA